MATPKDRPNGKPAANQPNKHSSISIAQILLFVLIAAAVVSLLWWAYLKYDASRSKYAKSVWPPEIEAQKQTASEGGLVYAGIPKLNASDATLIVLRNKTYVAGYSEFRKDPLWVAYSLEGNKRYSIGKRPSKFLTDMRTQSRVQHDDFTLTGFDRGHLAPNAGIAARFGPDGQKETFLLSNVVPMKPELNRRVWEKLERLEADTWAPRCGKIWVFTGPIFDAARQLLGEANPSDRSLSQVEIPDAFYKIIVDEDGPEIRVLPFIASQNVRGTESPRQLLSSVDRIEELTGIDFLWALNDPHEEAIERQTPQDIW